MRGDFRTLDADTKYLGRLGVVPEYSILMSSLHHLKMTLAQMTGYYRSQDGEEYVEEQQDVEQDKNY